MINRKKLYKRLWWVLFLLAIALIIGIANNLDGQVIHPPMEQEDFVVHPIEDGYGLKEVNLVTVGIYSNGKLVSNGVDSVFIYGDLLFGMDADTLKIFINERIK